MRLCSEKDYVVYYKSLGFDVFVEPKWDIQCIAIHYKNRNLGDSFCKAYEDSKQYLPLGVMIMPVSHNIIMWYIKKFMHKKGW